MKILGFPTLKKLVEKVAGLPTPVIGGGWASLIRESYSGAWQNGVVKESTNNLLAFSAVYACVSMISNDISKLRPKLIQLGEQGVWSETTSQAATPVLRKPNSYQNFIQFLNAWIVSKLLHGNTYVYKRRDNRGVVRELHVLDPRMVQPMVSPDGSVLYSLNRDDLAEIEGRIVPASEIIHDRAMCPWHPLVGVSPIYACGVSATQGIRIQENSQKFFENMSRPSGMLTAPAQISDAVAARLKQHWEENFKGANIGRVAVLGDSLSYVPMTIPASDAQLIEQLQWTAEDVARSFQMPGYKIGIKSGGQTDKNTGQQDNDYYKQTLQIHIECFELCMSEGLGLSERLRVELDTDMLLRMDPIARADANDKNIRSGVWAPNEARLRDNLPPVKGGDTPYMQQQNYSLAALADRDAQGFVPTGGSDSAKPANDEADDSDDEAKAAELRETLAYMEKELACVMS